MNLSRIFLLHSKLSSRHPPSPLHASQTIHFWIYLQPQNYISQACNYKIEYLPSIIGQNGNKLYYPINFSNQLSGVGRFRSQFNVDADGIKQARYYLPINPTGFIEETIGDCKFKCVKIRPNSIIHVNLNTLEGIITTIPQNI